MKVFDRAVTQATFQQHDYIILSDIGLEELTPDMVRKLRPFKKIDLSYNSFRTLPPEFGGLIELEELSLRDNQGPILIIPPEIEGLQNLKALDLQGSNVQIPPEFGKLRNLKRFHAPENLFPPREFSNLRLELYVNPNEYQMGLVMEMPKIHFSGVAVNPDSWPKPVPKPSKREGTVGISQGNGGRQAIPLLN